MKILLLALTLLTSIQLHAFEIEDNMSTVLKVSSSQSSSHQLILAKRVDKLGDSEDRPPRIILKDKNDTNLIGLSKTLRIFELSDEDYERLRPYFRRHKEDKSSIVNLFYSIDPQTNEGAIDKISFGNLFWE